MPSSHISYALLAGLLLAAWWAFSTPLTALGLAPGQQAGLGFILGVAMYGAIVVVYHA